MEFEIYSIAGISITQGEPREGCPIGFTPLLRARVCSCACASQRQLQECEIKSTGVKRCSI